MMDALNRIRKDFGVHASAEEKGKILIKFGANNDLDAGVKRVIADMPTGQNEEVYLSTSDGNLITHVASTDAGDDQDFKIEGHYYDAANGDRKTFSVQSGTLNGQNKVALTQPLCRATRWYNDDTTEHSGDIYVARDVTFTAGVPATPTTNTHLLIPAGYMQSRKCSTAVSYRDYWIITGFYAGIRQGTGGTAAVEVFIEYRLGDKVFRPAMQGPLRSAATSTVVHQLNPYVVIPAGADIRMSAIADTNNTALDAGLFGYLAIDLAYKDEPA